MLATNHFLSLPRPDPNAAHPHPTDTTTLAAHDFDVDNRTGFMPPQPPLKRLPPQWEPWERMLEDAKQSPGESWRKSVREMPTLPTKPLYQSELYLRRAHHVLAWTLHFYVHSLDDEETTTITIPRALSLPLLRVCTQLQLPPILTYSDTVLYNWDFAQEGEEEEEDGGGDRIPTFTSPLKCLTLFTGTQTEQEFYLLSVRIELRGVRALDLMRATMDEVFVGDDIAIRRITGFLDELKDVVRGMTSELRDIQSRGCDPDVFYRELRPWLKGVDPRTEKKWVFEGLDDDNDNDDDDDRDEPVVCEPAELSGPSAGQSSIIHALDIFLGVDKWSHATQLADNNNNNNNNNTPSFLTRMRQYMPRHHRAFLQHLSANPRPLRELVVTCENQELVKAYNGAVAALKEFRDAHMVVVALYIVGPARRAQAETAKEAKERELRGTGGTDMVRFLKNVRDKTWSAVIP